ncbi:major histocompatibility complex class I-related gene protein-like [Alosa alosa]|uniref:major histocompatibility complex class I-related gene protein-like n=1 Tax=Alosa alosa TaxID=278164 RepID=UPI0020152953|nr:major histocompatibility complex class I-related gene protein-like [Alosa alosa]
MLRLPFLFCSFQIFLTVKSGAHSLWALSTLIIGDTPFPEFITVGMLDDIQVFYYDSNVNNLRNQPSKHTECITQEAANLVFGDLYRRVKNIALFSKHQLNLTGGIHVQQEWSGCELLDGGIPGPLLSRGAFNGADNAEWQFSLHQKTLRSEGLWSTVWNHIEANTHELLCANVYGPVCIKALKNCLHIKKNEVMRKVKPRLRLLQKTLPDSKGAKVTCLATGFYPRHINLILLRDGQPVSDHQITGGELLPNGDETYQMSKSLEVSAEELQHHHYTCTAEHLSLDNKLDIGLEREWDPGATTILSSVTAVAVCLVGATCAVIIWWRRRRTGQASQASQSSTYTSAPSADLD